MPIFRVVQSGLMGALSLGIVLGIQQPIPPRSPRHRISPESVARPTVISTSAARPKLKRQVEWAKGLSHAEKLLALSQQVHTQLEAGPGQVPANLNAELKEIQKLTKQLQRELGY